jgi:hypothetical protein
VKNEDEEEEEGESKGSLHDPDGLAVILVEHGGRVRKRCERVVFQVPYNKVGY